MALIEGFGDEVVQFFGVFLLFILGVFAWWSTQISDRPYIRTVLIVEQNTSRSIQNEPVSSQQPAQNIQRISSSRNDPEVSESHTREIKTEVSSTENNVPGNVSASSPETLAAICRHHLSQGRNDRGEEQGSCSVTEIRNPDDNVSSQASVASSSSTHAIRIRLKYLNDDLKLVEGDLQEQLGEFKRRHFRLELSGRKLVRLIFNGHILGQDTNTLEHYGLFDNCVVHCVVHNARTPTPSPESAGNRTARTDDGLESNSERIMALLLNTTTLNLFLFLTFSSSIIVAWYCRFEYAQYFTANTTALLIGLTCIFLLTTAGLYIPNIN